MGGRQHSANQRSKRDVFGAGASREGRPRWQPPYGQPSASRRPGCRGCGRSPGRSRSTTPAMVGRPARAVRLVDADDLDRRRRRAPEQYAGIAFTKPSGRGSTEGLRRQLDAPGRELDERAPRELAGIARRRQQRRHLGVRQVADHRVACGCAGLLAQPGIRARAPARPRPSAAPRARAARRRRGSGRARWRASARCRRAPTRARRHRRAGSCRAGPRAPSARRRARTRPTPCPRSSRARRRRGRRRRAAPRRPRRRARPSGCGRRGTCARPRRVRS